MTKHIRKPMPKPSVPFKDKKKEENKNECRKKNMFLDYVYGITNNTNAFSFFTSDIFINY